MKVVRRLGWTLTADPESPFDLALLWDDQTRCAAPARLRDQVGERPFWNVDCTDISKQTVDRLAAETLGYRTLIDPTAFVGTCVEKHDDNASPFHARLVHCPLKAAKPGHVYQRFVDTRTNGLSRDIRVAVVKERLAAVYHFDRSYTDEDLRGPVIEASIVPVADVFEPVESTAIVGFARAIGLDYGELDVLRDRHDGRLYILDCNKTPVAFDKARARAWIDAGDASRSIELISAAVAAELGSA